MLNGVNNTLMEEKDGIDYLCATIDRLLEMINRMRKSKADQTVEGIYRITVNSRLADTSLLRTPAITGSS